MSSLKANKSKKVVNQEELRRLMKEKQKGSDRKKRVESPFAKYNSLGHLSCALCNIPVKSEILWQAHVLGKQHKDKVAELKGGKQQEVSGQSSQVLVQKRKALEKDESSSKRMKNNGASSSGAPQGFVDNEKKPSSLRLLSGVYDDDENSDNDNNVVAEGKCEPEKQASVDFESPASSGLPADFFDSNLPTQNVSHSGSISKPEEDVKVSERRGNTAEALPEGFFDDPVRDAKVRNVDTPKDVMDKEWDEFQKEMRQVNSASDAIVAEDDEEGRLDRQIDEIDEQIECYRRVELLRDKQDFVKDKNVQKLDSSSVKDGSDSDIDEDGEEELLHVLSRDWRAKGALV